MHLGQLIGPLLTKLDKEVDEVNGTVSRWVTVSCILCSEVKDWLGCMRAMLVKVCKTFCEQMSQETSYCTRISWRRPRLRVGKERWDAVVVKAKGVKADGRATAREETYPQKFMENGERRRRLQERRTARSRRYRRTSCRSSKESWTARELV